APGNPPVGCVRPWGLAPARGRPPVREVGLRGSPECSDCRRVGLGREVPSSSGRWVGPRGRRGRVSRLPGGRPPTPATAPETVFLVLFGCYLSRSLPFFGPFGRS